MPFGKPLGAETVPGPPPALLVQEDNAVFLAGIEAGSVRLIVTSPPYNIGKSYERREPLATYIASQGAVIAACVRVLAPGGSICWQVGTHVSTDGEVFPLDILLYPVFKDCGLILRNRIVWTFGHGLHARKKFSGRHETILWFTRPGPHSFDLDPVRIPSKYPSKRYYSGPRAGELSCNPLGKNPGDVWDIPNVKAKHVEKTEHPCQFPVALAERLVLALSSPGDTVLDPYMGVGSAMVAAVRHGRAAAGCDISGRYVEISRERVAGELAGTLLTRPLDRPVHVPSASGRG